MGSVESMRGTPLKKFGPYQVRQTHRGSAATWMVFDTRTAERLVFSFCRESAYFAADRLASGKPIQTPREMLDLSMRHFALIFPSRLRYTEHRYIVLGNGIDWVGGGLCTTDVTLLTPEGAGAELERRERERKEEARRLQEWNKTIAELDALRAEHGEPAFARTPMRDKEAETIAAYRAGRWPDADEHRNLYPIAENFTEYVPMGELVVGAFDVDPEWLDDARAAMRLMLACGANSDDDDADTLGVLRLWASRLAAKYEGTWTP